MVFAYALQYKRVWSNHHSQNGLWANSLIFRADSMCSFCSLRSRAIFSSSAVEARSSILFHKSHSSVVNNFRRIESLKSLLIMLSSIILPRIKTTAKTYFCNQNLIRNGKKRQIRRLVQDEGCPGGS